MKYVFNKTVIGYSHINSNTVCQDNSFSYDDGEKVIIGVADGHGGKMYVRSNLGSKFACMAAKETLEKLDLMDFLDEQKKKQIKIKLLSRWNDLVEKDFLESPFKFYELENLNDDEKEKLSSSFTRAYGTTLNCALITPKNVLCLSIGDGGLFVVQNGLVKDAIEESEDENVANITCSLCSEDALDHIHIEVFDRKNIDAVFCLTDGVVNPYQNYQNFFSSFIIPTIKSLHENGDKGVKEVKNYITQLGIKSGIGDDVSVAIYVDDKKEPNKKEHDFDNQIQVEKETSLEINSMNGSNKSEANSNNSSRCLFGYVFEDSDGLNEIYSAIKQMFKKK